MAQEFFLRHTVYFKVVDRSAVHAGEASLTIKDEIIEQLQNIGVEVLDYDMQKTWELVAQQHMQQH